MNSEKVFVGYSCYIKRPVLAWLILFSLNVRQSIAWRFSFSRSSLCHLRRFSSFSMTDQVPVVPADGAVAAAVDRPAVAAV